MAVTQRRAYLEAGAAALTFGAAAPAAKRLVGDVGPVVLGGLLYLGAGALLWVIGVMRPALGAGTRSRDAPLEWRDWKTMAAVIAAGGLAGPLCLLYGLARSTAMATSLLLNLEAVFTALLAAAVFRERIGARAALALAAIVAGALAVGIAPGAAFRGSLAGALAVVLACAAWAVDNNLTRTLADRDPIAIVTWKGLGAGSIALAAGLLAGGRLPSPRAILAALSVGAVGYGVSLVLYVRALRRLGAARTSALFATAPFIGAVFALPILGERPSGLLPLGGLLMVGGVVLLATERRLPDDLSRRPRDIDTIPPA